MVRTILAVLLIGALNLVICEDVDLGKDSILSVNSSDTFPDTKIDLTPETIDLISNVTEELPNTTTEKLSKMTEEVRDIVETLDKTVESIVNSTNPVRNSSKAPVLGSRGGFPVSEDEFQFYSRPTGLGNPIETSPLTAYNFQRVADSRRGTFSVYDSLNAEHIVSIPVRQILEGPINIAVPLINREISLYFVNRGLKSVKFTPSLLPISEALNRPVRKVGLTIPAAFSLRSRYLSWPVKSVVFAEPVFLADISNTATYPTVLFVPEDEFEMTRRTSDVFQIGDFALLEDGIRYALPSQKQVI